MVREMVVSVCLKTQSSWCQFVAFRRTELLLVASIYGGGLLQDHSTRDRLPVKIARPILVRANAAPMLTQWWHDRDHPSIIPPLSHHHPYPRFEPVFYDKPNMKRQEKHRQLASTDSSEQCAACLSPHTLDQNTSSLT